MNSILIKSNLTAETKFLKIYNTTQNGINYNIALIKKRADKKTWLDCKNESIIWKKAVFGIWLHRKVISLVICKPDSLIKKNCFNIIVVKGKPGALCGLDDGIFASVNKISKNPYDKKLYIMTEKEFKEF